MEAANESSDRVGFSIGAAVDARARGGTAGHNRSARTNHGCARGRAAGCQRGRAQPGHRDVPGDGDRR